MLIFYIFIEFLTGVKKKVYSLVDMHFKSFSDCM
jgi:hypothetical protein